MFENETIYALSGQKRGGPQLTTHIKKNLSGGATRRWHQGTGGTVGTIWVPTWPRF